MKEKELAIEFWELVDDSDIMDGPHRWGTYRTSLEAAKALLEHQLDWNGGEWANPANWRIREGNGKHYVEFKYPADGENAEYHAGRDWHEIGCTIEKRTLYWD